MQNVFLEIFAHRDVGLIEEGLHATRFNLFGNPLCYPRIGPGMTDEYEPCALSLLWLVVRQRLVSRYRLMKLNYSGHSLGKAKV